MGNYTTYMHTHWMMYILQSKVVKSQKFWKEFRKNLKETQPKVLSYDTKNGKFEVDEELTEKSMNFELDFDNYKE